MFDFPVVYVDIETTGASPAYAHILEVAAIRYEQGQVVREYSTLINPRTYVPASITQLTGIRSEDVADAPLFDDIADELMEILEGAVFVAHNVQFDYSFLKHELQRCGIGYTPKLLCTVRLSRALYSHEKGHSLGKLIERHTIPYSARHRALDDARAIAYFTQLAYDQCGKQVFDEAIHRQLRTRSTPPNVDQSDIDSIEERPGVYIFEDEKHCPLYVGKSINMKKRVLQHFQAPGSKDLKIMLQTHYVRTVTTGSELAALLMESKLVKELQPVYNRMLRRVSKHAFLVRSDTADGYMTIRVRYGLAGVDEPIDVVYGVYPTRTKAKASLDMLTKAFGLCPKLVGIEKTKGACFSYSLGTCRGACAGYEPNELYNRRCELALANTRIALWPYGGPVSIPLDEYGTGVVLQDWMVLGYYENNDLATLRAVEPTFDTDTYKIIRRFVRENQQHVHRYVG